MGLPLLSSASHERVMSSLHCFSLLPLLFYSDGTRCRTFVCSQWKCFPSLKIPVFKAISHSGTCSISAAAACQGSCSVFYLIHLNKSLQHERLWLEPLGISLKYGVWRWGDWGCWFLKCPVSNRLPEVEKPLVRAHTFEERTPTVIF